MKYERIQEVLTNNKR
jgi:hypothetical protein